MFRIGLLLAISAFLPSPASSVASGAAVAVCFAPEEDCAAFAVRAIDNAEREILVGAYGLTTGSGIVEALVRAKERGVDVRLIADKTTPCERASGIDPLATAGVPIWQHMGVLLPSHRHSRKRPPDAARRARRCRNWRTATTAAYLRCAAPRAPPDLYLDRRQPKQKPGRGL